MRSGAGPFGADSFSGSVALLVDLLAAGADALAGLGSAAMNDLSSNLVPFLPC